MDDTNLDGPFGLNFKVEVEQEFYLIFLYINHLDSMIRHYFLHIENLLKAYFL